MYQREDKSANADARRGGVGIREVDKRDRPMCQADIHNLYDGKACRHTGLALIQPKQRSRHETRRAPSGRVRSFAWREFEDEASASHAMRKAVVMVSSTGVYSGSVGCHGPGGRLDDSKGTRAGSYNEDSAWMGKAMVSDANLDTVAARLRVSASAGGYGVLIVQASDVMSLSLRDTTTARLVPLKVFASEVWIFESWQGRYKFDESPDERAWVQRETHMHEVLHATLSEAGVSALSRVGSHTFVDFLRKPWTPAVARSTGPVPPIAELRFLLTCVWQEATAHLCNGIYGVQIEL
ncbi:uncharacterized protein B0H18DRAFT_1104647 [Fomitopsis serialis]|uniref:uncharacterized protein n=1 Tax=Fomitopsis serialis TaxID=139415 RepID=UPI002007EF23|nr:uncharacterized protein B0H18DRAFT_1104647 [Neoantrodia serialis]KAH9925833.1 hypothetical protein B0H18DRAFT_1104647 [Neoantrodia serialis]